MGVAVKLKPGETAIILRVPHGHAPPKGYKPTDGRPAHHDKYGKNHVKIVRKRCAPKKKNPSKTRSS